MNTPEFTPWTLFLDVGIISALMLIGKLLRVYVPLIQRLFLPPSLLAGFLALILGPNALDILPLSGSMGTYAGILIAFVFSCIPFSSTHQSGGAHIRKMWSYSQSTMLLQWALGGLLGYLVLSAVWPVNKAFGIAMPAGYCGGHGSAAAIGQSFGQLGYSDMLTLAMTAATVGILSSVIIGLVVIKWGIRRGHASYLTDFKKLPSELRSGLLPPDKRESMGETTVSSISMDSLTFNLAIVGIVALLGYGLSKGVSAIYPRLELPVFSCAFIAGILIKRIVARTKAHDYVCPRTIGHLSGTFTDYLVAFGIASIKLSIVVQYIVPLLILLVVGLLFTILYILIMGRRLFKGENWLEKALFAWGWCTGTVAMGIALLRIVDPDNHSHTMEDYALAYIFIAPVEIALITLAPLAFVGGWGLPFSLACLVAGVAVAIVGYAHLKKKPLSA
ncbi:MAG: sodium:glutamate symporter [Prevotellaceae bacterium]|jgi:ESS family glutamate:Na+ symporter|nr:sodium:glutamate symporter [Prevotellaceae bacterium]